MFFLFFLQFNAETTDDIVPLMSYLKYTCHYLECLYDPLSLWRLSLEKYVSFHVYLANMHHLTSGHSNLT